jgi:hypothetical protein
VLLTRLHYSYLADLLFLVLGAADRRVAVVEV